MISYAMLSSRGGREINEDSIGMEKLGNEYGFFLADGLGGHGRGDAASCIAVKEAKEQFFREGASWDCMQRIFERSQESILSFRETSEAAGTMKTTFCALLISETGIDWGHIGDSRIYYFRNGRVEKQTRDHSVPQMLSEAGMIRPDEIRSHPDRNKLLQCMGTEWDGKPYEVEGRIPRRGEQFFLLCSDGFWEQIYEGEMERLLQRAKDPQTWLDTMLRIVRERGNKLEMDNYSAIAVWSEEK